ncbi:hypothetical protein HYG86_05690 [Alkalicella caledoniensis]|uniref:Lipoprotein n=1 Tax=Alkalicella caledoniensis TaxID=2731377 RepID=A0A7G9W6I7_ALKCA|nr:hypothetical protein [Alkalicella caledoniensis]QNO14299.1 hypothetical protein HYG86_05690 [Alkalicella caledoniensis]
MKGKFCVILVLFLMLSGCAQVPNTRASNPQAGDAELGEKDNGQEKETLSLIFEEITPFTLSHLTEDVEGDVLNEKKLDQGIVVKLFNNKTNGQVSGSIQVNGKVFLIEEVTMEGTSDEIYGIEETEVFGKKAIKIYGILGANHQVNYYWFYEQEQVENSVIKIEGNTEEIDLDDSGRTEIISSIGTVAETSIYLMREDKIMVTNINKSINVQAVYLLNRDAKIFEVYFGPNDMKHYYYLGGYLRSF